MDDLVLRDRDEDGNGTLEERLYVQQDATHTVTSLTNTSGTAVERYVYDAYGKPTVLTPTWDVRGSSSYSWAFLFQGLRYDTDTGLYDGRNRQLHATLGRWVQQDPAGYVDGANLYAMARGNPVRYGDPIGLSASDDEDGGRPRGLWGSGPLPVAPLPPQVAQWQQVMQGLQQAGHQGAAVQMAAELEAAILQGRLDVLALEREQLESLKAHCRAVLVAAGAITGYGLAAEAGAAVGVTGLGGTAVAGGFGAGFGEWFAQAVEFVGGGRTAVDQAAIDDATAQGTVLAGATHVAVGGVSAAVSAAGTAATRNFMRPQGVLRLPGSGNTAIPSLDDLSKAAAAHGRGGLTLAGRSLTKHGAGARPGNSLFPAATGNPAAINNVAQGVVDDILTAPGSVIRGGYRGRFGNTIEVTASDGRGVVYDASGKFLFFKE